MEEKKKRNEWIPWEIKVNNITRVLSPQQDAWSLNGPAKTLTMIDSIIGNAEAKPAFSTAKFNT